LNDEEIKKRNKEDKKIAIKDYEIIILFEKKNQNILINNELIKKFNFLFDRNKKKKKKMNNDI
jgi:hypothetical protein